MTNKEYMQKNEINYDFNSWNFPWILYRFYDKYCNWLDEECTEVSIRAMDFHKTRSPETEEARERRLLEHINKQLEEYLNENYTSRQ